MNVFAHRHFVYLALIVQCVLWYIVKDDPFFGDAIASTSVAANAIYEANLQTLFYPIEADPGHPTLYSYVLAVLWKLFGRSLWVAHVYAGIWALLLVFVFRKIARTLLEPEHVNRATLLLLLFPTYLSQSAMVLNTMAFTCFFMFALYGVLKNQRFTIILWASLMCLVHLQSAFMLLSLAMFDVYRTAKTMDQVGAWIRNRWWVYAVPFVYLMSWLWIHHQHTGWYAVSPQYTDHQELNGWREGIKALLLIGWRLVDYGLLPLYGILIWIAATRKHERSFLLQWMVLLLPCCLLMAIWLSHTIGHRYFMVYALLAMILAVYYALSFKPMVFKTVYLLLILCLGASNYLVYPGKNLGDATLAYRGFFKIEQQLHDSLGNTALYSYAPIANSRMLRHLAFKGIVTERITDSVNLDSVPIVLQSNINSEFTDSQKTYLLEHFTGRTLQSGAVYVNVFYNPVYYPDVKTNLRKPSPVELWMQGLKAKFR
jgi:hypothetical protein